MIYFSFHPQTFSQHDTILLWVGQGTLRHLPASLPRRGLLCKELQTLFASRLRDIVLICFDASGVLKWYRFRWFFRFVLCRWKSIPREMNPWKLSNGIRWARLLFSVFKKSSSACFTFAQLKHYITYICKASNFCGVGDLRDHIIKVKEQGKHLKKSTSRLRLQRKNGSSMFQAWCPWYYGFRCTLRSRARSLTSFLSQRSWGVWGLEPGVSTRGKPLALCELCWYFSSKRVFVWSYCRFNLVSQRYFSVWRCLEPLWFSSNVSMSASLRAV